MGHPVQFNRAVLGEALTVGQRVESYEFDYWNGSSWQKVSTPTTPTIIGYKNLLTFNTIQAQRVRVLITQSRAEPTLATFGFYLESPLQMVNDNTTGSGQNQFNYVGSGCSL